MIIIAELIVAFNQKRVAITGIRAITKLIPAEITASHIGTSILKMPELVTNVQASRLINAPNETSHNAGLNALLKTALFVMLLPPQDILLCILVRPQNPKTRYGMYFQVF